MSDFPPPTDRRRELNERLEALVSEYGDVFEGDLMTDWVFIAAWVPMDQDGHSIGWAFRHGQPRHSTIGMLTMALDEQREICAGDD